MNDETPRMTSHRPYLLRALVEWIADNGMTPHLLVDATQAGVQVPASAVKEGKVVLNIAERAVVQLHIDNHSVSFTARFGGVSFPVMVPISAVLAIYARETGQGMALPDDGHSPGPDDDGGDDGAGPDSPGDDDTPVPPKRPHLRVVK
jgi:stringent starvation protein B